MTVTLFISVVALLIKITFLIQDFRDEMKIKAQEEAARKEIKFEEDVMRLELLRRYRQTIDDHDYNKMTLEARRILLTTLATNEIKERLYIDSLRYMHLFENGKPHVERMGVTYYSIGKEVSNTTDEIKILIENDIQRRIEYLSNKQL